MKTVKGLTLLLCKREGKKKQVDIAQMSETMGHLSDISYELFCRTKMVNVGILLVQNGRRRALRKAKTKNGQRKKSC